MLRSRSLKLIDRSYTCLRLPLCFDPQMLKADLARIEPAEWTAHYNDADYAGEWRGVALRSLSKLPGDLGAHAAGAASFGNTALLERLPHFHDVLSIFRCPLKGARLLSLSPDSLIREHSDPGLAYANGEIRFHVPVQTSAGVEFYLDSEQVRLEEGRCYYIDASRPHRARNRSCRERVHLVIDAEVNEWVSEVLEKGSAVERIPPSPAGFYAFRLLVAASPDLQQQLHGMPSAAELRRKAVELGRERGFDFDEEETVSDTLISARPDGEWLPTAAQFRDSRAFAEWVYFGNERLTEPFFEMSVRRALRNPFARAFKCESAIEPSDSVSHPAGFIFHMSRSGSTLIAQMLASISRTVSISEAGAVDDVIQAGKHASAAAERERDGWLRAIVAALGRSRCGEDRYFVKLDAWHIHDLPLFRRAFPDAPWIFLYRDPIEVLTSQMRIPGRLALPGALEPAMLGFSFEDVTKLQREEWCARALAGFCRAALRFHSDPKGMLLNYNRLPDAVWGAVSRHFGIDFDAGDIERMKTAAGFNAKQPAVPFTPDSQQKRDEASPVVRNLAARLLDPLYVQLERCSSRAY